MIIKFQIHAVFLGTKEYSKKDGSIGQNITIETDGEAGSMNAEIDFTKVDIKKYSPCLLSCEINDKYGYIKATDIVPYVQKKSEV